MNKIAEFLGLLVAYIIKNLYNCFSWGYVLFNFWDWFIMPVFTTAPDLTYFNSVGISAFTVILRRINMIVKEEYRNMEKENFHFYLIPWFTLFVGYLIKLIIT